MSSSKEYVELDKSGFGNSLKYRNVEIGEWRNGGTARVQFEMRVYPRSRKVGEIL